MTSASQSLSRRTLLARSGGGLGLLALADLLHRDGRLGSQATAAVPTNALAVRDPHFAARAKSVIYLFMNGGPSQVDTWDYKPELEKRDGQTLDDFDNTTGFFRDQVGGLLKSPFAFAQHGESGTWCSEIFPALSQQVDKLAFIHSCWTDSNNHSPALFKLNTGFTRMGFPSVGAWVTYGLGSESQDLPGFVVMYDTKGRGLPKGYAQNWGSGFLPGVYQGPPSSRRAHRSTICSVRRTSPSRHSVHNSTCCASSMNTRSRRNPVKRSSRRELKASSSPTACRQPLRRPSQSSRSRPRRRNSTESETSAAIISPGNA